MKIVTAADAKSFSKDYSWSGFSVHSGFTQKIEKGVHKVHVKKKVRKGWYGTFVNMDRAGITGQAGYPEDGFRWARTDGVGELPTQYHDGTDWVDMPAGFVPGDDEYWNATFAKSGNKFELRDNPGVYWPEAFADYDFNSAPYKKKRADWIQDTHDRFTEKAILSPKSCPKGPDEAGCGYKLELTLEFDVATTWADHAIAMCAGYFRSDAATFSLEDNDIAMAAHETGHLVGLPDEYVGGAVDTATPDDDGLVSGIDSDSIMGQNLTKVKKRHYVNFAAMAKELLKSKTGAGLDLIAVYPKE
jgi:hypothetical protein